MKNKKHKIAAQILKSYKPKIKDSATAFAPSNIALCKYWGKRDQNINLPVNSSISVSLNDKGTKTSINYLSGSKQDLIYLNGKPIDSSQTFYQKIEQHINLFRHVFGKQYFCIQTFNNIPTKAGLASSASGFAALTKALTKIYNINIADKKLSILARLGSGSACRSLFDGFVYWHQGKDNEGFDSYAEPLPYKWPSLRIGLIILITKPKAVDSRSGMQRTIETSELYSSWPKQAKSDLLKIKHAIEHKDILLLGKTSEHNALTMHATMLSSWPPLFYWCSETFEQFKIIWDLRKKGIQVYATMDAGPNIKILFEKQDEHIIRSNFSNIEIVTPFV